MNSATLSDSQIRKYKSAYRVQKARAKGRGIGWEFTFETWISFWLSSGKLEQRGCGKGLYVMSRFGDVGPYHPGNVEVVPFEKNAGDAHRNKPETRRKSTFGNTGSGRGWKLNRYGRYEAKVGKHHIGTFDTAEEASAAYQLACTQYRAFLLEKSSADKFLLTPVFAGNRRGSVWQRTEGQR